jgi:anaerobic selenocysteine-containing dehydrogenase
MKVPAFTPEHAVHTVCPLDCPDACSLEVAVQDGRIASIDGTHVNPTTDGYICAKVRRFPERVYGPDRLLYPAIRKGPKGDARFERVSWEEALGTVAERLIDVKRRWGAEAILPYCYGGSNGLLTQDTSDATLFRRLGASRLARTVCAAPTGAANLSMYGKMPSITYTDFHDSRLIILWGANPSTSGIHLVSHIREAQRRGAKLIVIDPRTTPLAKQADIHLAVRPGTDLPVALSLHRFLFEEGHADEAFLTTHARGAAQLRERARPWTFERAAVESGVSADILRRVGELYAMTRPAVVRCGYGQERNRNGGSASLAILALPAVAGKFGERGGGYMMSNSASWGITNTWTGAGEPATRVINMNQLGRALTEMRPPIRLLFVYNSNPAVTTPDQHRVLRGLERDDLFTVVFEQVMTDTARYADVVLPNTTFLEGYDLVKSYGPWTLGLGRPVIEPIGESRSNADVFGELLDLTGLREESDPRGELEEMLNVLNCLPGATGDQVRDSGSAKPPFDAETSGGLYVYHPDPATGAFPLALISPASDKTISSTLAEIPRPEVRLLMNPDDAAERAIAEGDEIRMFNELGEVRCKATVGGWIRRGVVSLPKGIWRRHTLNGYTGTSLVPDALTDIGGGACFNDARVQVEPVAASPKP